MPKRRYPESLDQQAFFQWLKILYPEVYSLSTANGAGGKRNIREAARLKAEGLKKDFPDISIYWPIHPFHGLFIEMKDKATGRATLGQKEKVLELNRAGYCARFAFGLDEAINIATAYLEQEIPF